MPLCHSSGIYACKAWQLDGPWKRSCFAHNIQVSHVQGPWWSGTQEIEMISDLIQVAS